MRMLEIFSTERTYLPVIPDANNVASLLEQILHYMVQKGKLTGLTFISVVSLRSGFFFFLLFIERKEMSVTHRFLQHRCK